MIIEELPFAHMPRFFFSLFALFSTLFFSSFAEAEFFAGDLLLKHEYHHFTVSVEGKGFLSPSLPTTETPQDFCFAEEFVGTGSPAPSPEGTKAVNTAAIKAYLEEIAKKIQKDATTVTITKDEKGNTVFDGYGQFGERLNRDLSTELIKNAIEQNIGIVTLAVEKTPPTITVSDKSLTDAGIKDLIAIGQSNFSGSSSNRRFNLSLAASHFNGLLIPKGETFSFNTSLGNVSFATGYKSSPVIIGDAIEDGVGGGVCQVSTTAFRGAMLAGVEITERWNHRFAISMYMPYGSDATVYEGVKDFQFVNNTPGAILLQTRIEGDELYFYYYGTKDSRNVEILGPYKYGYVGPPAPKILETADLPPGTQKVEEGAIGGFRTAYSRVITFLGAPENPEETKPFLSNYSPKPKLILRGSLAPVAPEGGTSAPASSGEVPRTST